MGIEPKKKTGGRKKGIGNKVTTTLRQRIDLFINRNFEAIQDEYDTLPAKEKLNFISQLFAYSVPKLASTTSDVNIKTKLEELSTDQLEKVVNQVLMESE